MILPLFWHSAKASWQSSYGFFFFIHGSPHINAAGRMQGHERAAISNQATRDISGDVLVCGLLRLLACCSARPAHISRAYVLGRIEVCRAVHRHRCVVRTCEELCHPRGCRPVDLARYGSFENGESHLTRTTNSLFSHYLPFAKLVGARLSVLEFLAFPVPFEQC